jgi:hypothetical protein
MNHAETVAQRVLESILPCTMEHQSEQSHGEYDFELRYHSGDTAAVEVTASVDQEQRETIAAIHSKKTVPFIHATNCLTERTFESADPPNVIKDFWKSVYEAIRS